MFRRHCGSGLRLGLERLRSREQTDLVQLLSRVDVLLYISVSALLIFKSNQRMSSDGYFDGEDFDADALAQLDAIEAAHFSPTKHMSDSPNNRRRPPPPPRTEDDPFDDFSFNANESDLRKLDEFIKESYETPVAGPSNPFARTSSTSMVQTTLFGGVASQKPSTNVHKSRADMQRTTSTQRNLFGRQPLKTKKWDQTAFSKSGVRPPKSKDKGKGRADDEGQEEPIEFEQFPAPFVSGKSMNLIREDIPESIFFNLQSGMCISSSSEV